MFKFLGHTQFWRSVQLRKKLCYFMIMLLSCCDLLAILTNNPLMALITMSWLTGKVDGNARWTVISFRLTGIFLGFSSFTLLVMNFDRYLATSYPIFHRTSVTKGRLLTLLAILIIVDLILKAMSAYEFVISVQVYILTVSILLIPATLFFNYKLFLVVRKSRRNKRISLDMKKDVFFEKYIELFAGSRLSCGGLHPMVRLHWIKSKLARNKKYLG